MMPERERKEEREGQQDDLREGLVKTWGREKFRAIMESLAGLEEKGIDMKDLRGDMDAYIRTHVREREIFFTKDGL